MNIAPEIRNPCSPSPCGINAICREFNGAGSCSCPTDYIGDPYEACRPECLQNSDCLPHLACANSKCKDPCPGTCGANAQCEVINHLPSCTCNAGFNGDAFRNCVLLCKTMFFFLANQVYQCRTQSMSLKVVGGD